MTVLVSGDRTAPWAPLLHVNRVLKPLKYEVEINRRVLPETTPPDAPISYIDISTVDADGKIGNPEQLTFETAPSRARRLPSPGDTIVSTVRTYLRAIAFLESVESGTVCSTGFAVVTPGARLDAKFLSYWLRSDLLVDEVCARSVGVSYPGINASEIGNLPVPLLPLGVQRGIAAFLDRKTAAIDNLIAKKERQIELLEEKRQALITEVVTKGLDPIVPMKDSGVDCLGTIPELWGWTRVKHACSDIVDGVHSTPTYVEKGVPFVTVKNLTAGYGISFDDLNFITNEDHVRFTRRACPARGDVLITKDGATLGVCRVVEVDTAFSIFVSVALLKLRKDLVDPFYFCAVMESELVWQQFESHRTGAALPHLHLNVIGDVFIPVPPLEEQKRIGLEIRKITGRNDELRDRNRRLIDRLREYRQAIISAAVTGKIEILAEEAA